MLEAWNNCRGMEPNFVVVDFLINNIISADKAWGLQYYRRMKLSAD